MTPTLRKPNYCVASAIYTPTGVLGASTAEPIMCTANARFVERQQQQLRQKQVKESGLCLKCQPWPVLLAQGLHHQCLQMFHVILPPSLFFLLLVRRLLLFSLQCLPLFRSLFRLYPSSPERAAFVQRHIRVKICSNVPIQQNILCAKIVLRTTLHHKSRKTCWHSPLGTVRYFVASAPVWQQLPKRNQLCHSTCRF